MTSSKSSWTRIGCRRRLPPLLQSVEPIPADELVAAAAAAVGATAIVTARRAQCRSDNRVGFDKWNQSRLMSGWTTVVHCRDNCHKKKEVRALICCICDITTNHLLFVLAGVAGDVLNSNSNCFSVQLGHMTRTRGRKRESKPPRYPC